MKDLIDRYLVVKQEKKDVHDMQEEIATEFKELEQAIIQRLIDSDLTELEL